MKQAAFICAHNLTPGVISEYKKLCRAQNVDAFLMLDNTKGFVEPSKKILSKNIFGVDVKILPHDIQNVKELGVPRFSADCSKNETEDYGKIMWANADYRFFIVSEFLPEYDYYWLLEYDVFCNGESYGPFFEKYLNSTEDLLVTNFGLLKEDSNWFWRYNADWAFKDGVKYSSFFPVCRLSRGAISYLKKRRFELKEEFLKCDDKCRWAFCEVFVPNALMEAGYTARNICEKGVRFEPEYDLNEDRIFETPDNKLYHPVKGDFLNRLKAFQDKEKRSKKLLCSKKLGFKISIEKI